VSKKWMEGKVIGKSPLLATAARSGAPGIVEAELVSQGKSSSEGDPSLRLNCGSARDDAEDQMTAVELADYSVVIPWLMAEAEPNPEWWVRMRRDPKRAGEVSQLAFLLKAKTMGFKVALPWGDSERWDCVVWMREGSPMLRVQVKGTGRLYRRGYEVQPVHSTRGQGKKRYTKREIDVLVGHVQPVDAWYLIPIEELRGARSLRLYPDIDCPWARWDQWREKWEVLERKI
jgi:hypothetical protein